MGRQRPHSFDPDDVDTLLETGGGILNELYRGHGIETPDPDRWVGREAGAYRLTEFIAAGGMSLVYRGERSDGEFDMPVAVKLINAPGSAALVARFTRERQILATMQHPQIARIIDGGAEDGQPYLVMELVEGEAIDEYCDRHRLDIHRRLRLMEQVCDAVQFAHGRLVVHRDIKPSNILVNEDGQVKLLDFGIARVLESDDADLTTRSPILTPRFASPEMVRGEPAHVASDIYQLGLLLYLLLTGRHAQDPERGSLSDITSAVLEQSPPNPSQAVAELKRSDMEAARVIASARATRPERLTRLLQGDLDAIVATCLRKRPERRYSAVTDLASDLRAFRDQRPVQARSPTRVYRLKRFIERHRGGVIASLLTLMVLLGSLLAVTLSYRTTLEAQQRAEEEAGRARQVTTLLTDLLEGADPDTSLGRELTVVEMLDQATRRADSALSEQPHTEAALRTVIGQLYSRLGRDVEGRKQLERALDLMRRSAPSDVAEAAGIQTALARVLLSLGEVEHAESTVQEAYETRSSSLGAGHPDTLDSRVALVEVWTVQGRYDEARAAATEIVERLQQLGPAGRDRLIQALGHLARIDAHRTDYQAAVSAYEEAIELQRDLSPGPSMRLADLMRSLSETLVYLGEKERSLELANASMAMTRELMGDEHPATALGLMSLAGYHGQAGNLDQAEQALLEAADIVRSLVGEEHDVMATLMNNMAVLRFRQERYEEASDYYTRSIDIYRKLFGEDHPLLVSTVLYRAYGWHLAGDPRAESAYRELIPKVTEIRGPDHVHTSHVHADLGRLLVETGRNGEAIAHLRRALEIRREKFGDQGAQMIADVQLYLGAALSETGETDEADRLLNGALEARHSAGSQKEQRLLEARLYLSRHLLRIGESDRAAKLFHETYSSIRESKAKDHWLLRLAEQIIASAPELGEA